MSLTMKVKRGKTRDLEKVLKHFQNLNQLKVDIGYFEDSGTHSTADMPYAKLMAIHELGLEDMPVRPLLQEASYQIQSEGNKVLKNEYLQLFGQVGRTNKNTELLGDKILDLVRQLFGDSYLFQDNAPSTIAQKGGRNEPLHDTGELGDNLGFKTTDNRTVRK